MFSVFFTVLPWSNPEDSMSDYQENESLDNIDTANIPILDVINMFQNQLPRRETFDALRVVKNDAEVLSMERISFNTGKTIDDLAVEFNVRDLFSVLEVIGKAADKVSKLND